MTPILPNNLIRPVLSAEMSLEDVVYNYGEDERERRVGTTPEEQSSTRTCIKSSVIVELASSIRIIAPQMSREVRGTTQSVLTKCMARHLVYWYKEVLEIDRLASRYSSAFNEAKRGHTTLRLQMERETYQYSVQTEKPAVLWEVPTFVLSELSEWGKPLGASVHQLLVVGMAWSLTTLKHIEWDKDNILRYFLPETKYMEKTIKFRELDIDCTEKKLKIDK